MSRGAGGPERRKQAVFLALILLVGALLRLAYFFELRQAPDFDLPQFEAQYHDYWARALTTGDWTPPAGVTDPEIEERPYFRPPGYPYFLAAVYRLFGLGHAAPRLLQMLLGLLNVYLAYALTRLVFGRRAALIAAALMATGWTLIFFEGELMAPTLLIALLLASLFLLLRRPHQLATLALAGALLGAAALVRPNALVLLPCCLLWLIWIAWREKAEGGRPARVAAGLAAFALAAALVVLPATLRNFARQPDVVWITSNAGINLFIGTHPQSDGYTPGVPELGELTGLSGWDSFDYPIIARAVEARLGRPLSDAEVSAYFSERALAYSVEHPLAVARLFGRKLLLFWSPHEISNNKVLELERRHSATLRLGPGFTTILALALFGLLVLALPGGRWTDGGEPARRRTEAIVLLLAVIAVYSASFLPFFAAARFRVPLIPLLIVFAAHGVDALWRQLEARRFKAFALGLIGLLALGGLTRIAWLPYQPDEALWHYRRGLLHRMRGEPAAAIGALRRAVELAPENAEARFALADELARTGRLDDAAAEYRAVLEQRPGWAMAHNNLATALARQGDVDGAVAAWRRALEIDPTRLAALNNLALTLARRDDPAPGDRERAVELAERACEQTGYSQPALLRTLILTYRAAGRDDDALRIEQRLARLGPG